MDIYHVWCNPKPGVSDVELCDRLDTYLDHLREHGHIEGFRITRRKLGLGPSSLPEFHIMLEVRDLAQLEQAFRLVGTRSGDVESLHHSVNSLVCDVMFALYRDFPDPWRERGGERF
ncbi:MAG: hypothetical protein KDK91_19185 [Gammaproteobacteria bacterium]|nr:hypothetical protein [Gammaproteobacteria bacterium]